MDELGAIQKQLDSHSNKPPLHLWDPDFSGDIDIVIRANGDWFHEGGLIKRKALVKLFASILRKEQDGSYYLVTPVEKWRIVVEDTPLIIFSMDVHQAGSTQQQIIFKTNMDDSFLLSKKYPLSVVAHQNTGEPNPTILLDHQLTAKINRSVYYELADHSVMIDNVFSVLSDGCYFELV